MRAARWADLTAEEQALYGGGKPMMSYADLEAVFDAIGKAVFAAPADADLGAVGRDAFARAFKEWQARRAGSPAD